jgi:hypothetical protein
VKRCDTSNAVSSYATVFASNLLQKQIATTAGPVDGHPAMATLYIIYRVSCYYNIVEGAMTFYCDNKGALNNAFKAI